MLTREVWKELNEKWPPAFWDDWMRKTEQRKDRACIRPEISRTAMSKHGKVGVSRLGTILLVVLLILTYSTTVCGLASCLSEISSHCRDAARNKPASVSRKCNISCPRSTLEVLLSFLSAPSYGYTVACPSKVYYIATASFLLLVLSTRTASGTQTLCCLPYINEIFLPLT